MRAVTEVGITLSADTVGNMTRSLLGIAKLPS